MGRAGGKYVRRYRVYAPGHDEAIAYENETSDAFQIASKHPGSTVYDTAADKKVPTIRHIPRVSLDDILRRFR